MYGHGAVEEIPLGEYRRLTYAIHNVPVHAPGAGDHPVVSTWKDEWGNAPPAEMASGTAWYSTLVDPTTNGSQVTYGFGQENTVTLTHVFDNGVDPPTQLPFESFSFRNIIDGTNGADAGRIMAFHVSSDVEHRHVPDDVNPPHEGALQSTGYGAERTTLTLTYSGSSATVNLRGVLPDGIKGQCPGDDRDCANWITNDSTGGTRVELDDILLYYCDRHGLPPDVVKAQVYHESQGYRMADGRLRMPSNAYRYEPWTWDYMFYTGCDTGQSCRADGLLCNGTKVTNMRLIALQPFCAYAQGGFIQDLYNDGLQPDIDGIPGYFGATLSAAIPAGTPAGPGNPVAVDIANLAPPTGSPPYPSDRARFVLFEGGTFDDPYCIDLDATDPGTGIQICVNGAYSANRDQYQVRLGDGGIEWGQAGQRDHRILATGPVNNAYPNGPQLDDVHAGRDPNGFEFSLGLFGGYGGAGGTDEVILGSEPGTDLTLDVKPMLLTEIPEGSKIMNLPSDIPSLEVFLNSLWDGDPSDQGRKEYPSAALSINDWVKHNHQIFGGFNAILRVGGGAHNYSQNFLECDLGEGDLYDPKFSYLRNQYVLAASFGMMQVGMITYRQEDHLGMVLTSEYDLMDVDRHVLYLAKFPMVAIRAGTAVDKVLLYDPTIPGAIDFQSSCREKCSILALRSALRGMLGEFNGNSFTYPKAVIDDPDISGGPARINYFSTHPEIWRMP